jgi:hypothetical protein
VSCIRRCWYTLWPFGIFCIRLFGIFCGYLVYFVAIWYILWLFGTYILWLFGKFLQLWYVVPRQIWQPRSSSVSPLEARAQLTLTQVTKTIFDLFWDGKKFPSKFFPKLNCCPQENDLELVPSGKLCFLSTWNVFNEKLGSTNTGRQILPNRKSVQPVLRLMNFQLQLRRWSRLCFFLSWR